MTSNQIVALFLCAANTFMLLVACCIIVYLKLNDVQPMLLCAVPLFATAATITGCTVVAVDVNKEKVSSFMCNVTAYLTFGTIITLVGDLFFVI